MIYNPLLKKVEQNKVEQNKVEPIFIQSNKKYWFRKSHIYLKNSKI